MSSVEFPGALNRPPIYEAAPGAPGGGPPDPNRPGTPGSLQRQLDEERRRREEMEMTDRFVRQDYRSAMTVVGEDLIMNIKERLEVDDYQGLQRAIEKALPLMVGLEKGVYAQSYGIPETEADRRRMTEKTEETVYGNLRNMFMTVEDSTERRNTVYLNDAIHEALARPLRELEYWDQDAGQTWEAQRRQFWRERAEQVNEERRANNNPNFPVLTDAEIQNRIDQRISREKPRQERKMARIRDEKENLVASEWHVDSVLEFDSAFIQRQYTAFNRDLQADLKTNLGLRAAEPDAPDWQGFYQVDRNWGEAVDKVERELKKMGEEGYFHANPDTKAFKSMMDRMLSASYVNGDHCHKKRMDVVFAAWKMWCFKEMAGKYSTSFDWLDDRDHSKGHRIEHGGNPPYVGDLSTWLSRPELHRAQEFGWNKETLETATNNKKLQWNGKVVGARSKPYRAISHAGHPRGIGNLTNTPAPTRNDPMPIARFGRIPVGNFMEFSTFMQGNRDGKNLWHVWTEEGISQADPNFPWIDTDFAGQKDTSDEAPSGSVGYWFLQRSRALKVLSENLGIPKERDMNSVAYQASLRNWEKLKMIQPGKFMENPIFVRIYSDVSFFQGYNASELTKLEKGENLDSELEFTAVSNQEVLITSWSSADVKGISIKDYLTSCLTYGLIDKNEYLWLVQNVKIKS